MSGRNEDDRRNSDQGGKIKTRDLIVLNLPYATVEEDMEEYFTQFGVVEFCEVKKDRDQKSRGFGFIRFSDIDSQRTCLTGSHKLLDREIRVQRPQSKGDDVIQRCMNRLFVAKVSSDLCENDLRQHFEQFGRVKEACIPPNTKGFAFLTFENIEGVYEALDVGEEHYIKNTRIVITCAEPKKKDMSSDDRRRSGGGRSDRRSAERSFGRSDDRNGRRDPPPPARYDRYDDRAYPRKQRDYYEREPAPYIRDSYYAPPQRMPISYESYGYDSGNGFSGGASRRYEREELPPVRRERRSRSPMRTREPPREVIPSGYENFGGYQTYDYGRGNGASGYY